MATKVPEGDGHRNEAEKMHSQVKTGVMGEAFAIHDESFCKERAAAMRALADQAISRDLRRDYLTMSREWKEIARSAQGSAPRPPSPKQQNDGT